MGVKDMYPLDFEEFISCVGISDAVIGALREAWKRREAVDEFVHGKIMELFRLYLVVGGMPAAVSKYIESNNLQEVMTVQQDIIRLYKRDIARYDPDNKLYIEEIFNLIPPELNAKNKRFILKRLNEHAKFDRVESSFLWLTNAGVALPVYNVEEPKVPLLLNRSRNLFKLFQSDVGLLATSMPEVSSCALSTETRTSISAPSMRMPSRRSWRRTVSPPIITTTRNGASWISSSNWAVRFCPSR